MEKNFWNKWLKKDLSPEFSSLKIRQFWVFFVFIILSTTILSIWSTMYQLELNWRGENKVYGQLTWMQFKAKTMKTPYTGKAENMYHKVWKVYAIRSLPAPMGKQQFYALNCPRLQKTNLSWNKGNYTTIGWWPTSNMIRCTFSGIPFQRWMISPGTMHAMMRDWFTKTGQAERMKKICPSGYSMNHVWLNYTPASLSLKGRKNEY